MLNGVLSRAGRLLRHRSIWLPAILWQAAAAVVHAPRDLRWTSEVTFVLLLNITAFVLDVLGAWVWLSTVEAGVAVSKAPSSDWRLVPGVLSIRVLATVCILAVPIAAGVLLAAIPSIYLLARWQLTIPVVLEHDPGLRESMEESSNLTRGFIPQIIVSWLSFGVLAWAAHWWIGRALAVRSVGWFIADRAWISAVWLGSAVLLAAIYAELSTIDLEGPV